VFEDSQIWLMIGVIVGAVAVLVLVGIMVNAYITSRRLANVLSDVEEVMHADFKALEEKVDAVLNRLRSAEARSNRE
jgi:hypothetical protein